MSDIGSVIDYWFGANADDAAKSHVWFKADAAVDDEIRTRFGALVEAAGRNELSAWTQTPEGLLALILLSDQFPRNIFRNTSRAFAYDPAALAHCKLGIARGFDILLRPIERVFHYLPLEHSESIEDQQEAVRLFSELVQTAATERKAVFADFLRYAERHRDVIARFGRFPHRNFVFGRASTPEEVVFLKQPGSSF